MITRSTSIFPQVEISFNVLVNVSEVDRRCVAPRNDLAVVIRINVTGPFQLENKEGLFDRF